MIGSDYYWHVVIGDIIHGDSGPVALNSHFGWLISGPTKSLSENYIVSTLIIDGDESVSAMEYSDNQLAQDLSRFWNTETIGIVDIKQQSIEQFPPELVFDWEGYISL